MAAARIDIAVGDVVIQAEAVPAAGSELTAGKAARAAENVADAFSRAQDTIVQVARSTAEMISQAGEAARPDHVEVAFGLGFTAAGGVLLAGVAGQATLKVTLAWDTRTRPAGGDPEAAGGEPTGDAGAAG